MSADAAVEPTKSAPPSPSTDGAAGSDEKRRWDDHTSNSDSADVVNYNQGVDVAVDLVAGSHADDVVDPVEAARVRRKIDWAILPLLFAVYLVQGIDKGGLGASAILGIIKDTHLSTNEFNNTGSAFYIGYLVFQLPQQLALQRFRVGRWLTFNIFLWALFVGLQATCASYAGIFTVRFLLGATEGCVTAGVMLVCSMFYTRTEIGERIGWTFNLNGFALIVSSFLSFATLHTNPKVHPNKWQWLMLIESLLTCVVFVLFYLFFPDNPTTARFLTREEKIVAVKRVQGNQNGIETKVWKKHQFLEALTDPKNWLFFFFAAIANLQNGIGTQYALIIKSFGFSVLETTLLSIPSGAAQIINVTIGCLLLRRFPNSRSWIAIGFFIPSITGAVLLITLPWHNRNGLLVAYYILNLGGTASFVMMLSWVTSTNAGHTKKLTANGMFLVGYALGQILCTQFWKQAYKPRNYVPWSITLASYACDITLILALRLYLQAENARRDRALAVSGLEGGAGNEDEKGHVHHNKYDENFGYVEKVGPDGIVVRQKVEKALLDLTDRENLAFRYVL